MVKAMPDYRLEFQGKTVGTISIASEELAEHLGCVMLCGEKLELSGGFEKVIVGRPKLVQFLLSLPEPPITDDMRAWHEAARDMAKTKGPAQTVGDLLFSGKGKPPEVS